MPSHVQSAYLGMYDFPALYPAQDAWWSGLVRHFLAQGFGNLPRELLCSVADPYDIWLTPNLFLAQTCGFPLTHRLAGKVRLVGTPCYDAPGCDGALYRSLFIVRSDSGIDNLSAAFPARVAVNDMDSYSGWQVLRRAVGEHDMEGEPFSETIISGSHANSIDLVREGTADIAAIDCVTHALIGDVEPERLAGTHVLEPSPLAPGLPYVTKADMSDSEVGRMAFAIQNAFVDPELENARRTLRLAGFNIVSLQEYERFMA